MNINLTLSKSSANCTSTWECYNSGSQGDPYYEYTTPTWDYDNIQVTVPAELSGAVINSVTLRVTANNVSGTRYIRFADTREDVTNARLLDRLKKGDTSIPLLFGFKAAGGSGRPGSNSATSRWTDITISVDYLPASAISGTVSAGQSSVFYAIKETSLLLTETGSLTLAVTPSAAASEIRMDMRLHGAGTFITFTWQVNMSAGQQTALQNTFTPGGIPISVHAAPADIRFGVTTGAGLQLSEWISTPLRLVRERYVPAVSCSFTDAGSAFGLFDCFVQNESLMRAQISVALDTDADPDISVSSRLMEIAGRSLTSGDGSFDIGQIETSGSVPYTVTVTDSHGMTGTLEGTVSINAYAPPALTALEIQRYVTKQTEGGESYDELSDDGTHVWMNIRGSVSAVNGKNAWQIKAAYDGAEHVLLTGSDGRVLDNEHDKTLITREFSELNQWPFTVTLSDKLYSVSYSLTLPKAGAIFSIERGGVGFGRRCTAPAAAPELQCAYPARFYAGIFDADGKPIGGSVEYAEAETEIGTYFGRKLYRKCKQVGAISSSSSSPTTIDFGITPAHVVKIDGYVSTNSYGELPINCYHSSSVRAFCRPDGLTGKFIAYTGSSNSGAVIIVEYTK